MKKIIRFTVLILLLLSIIGCKKTDTTIKIINSSIDVFENDFVRLTYTLEDLNHTLYYEVNRTDEFTLPNPYLQNHLITLKFNETFYKVKEQQEHSTVSYGIVTLKQNFDYGNIPIKINSYTLNLNFEDDISGNSLTHLNMILLKDNSIIKTEEISLYPVKFTKEYTYLPVQFKLDWNANRFELEVYENEDVKEIVTIQFID